MPRKSVKSLGINANLRCLKVYPSARTKKQIQDLQTIGIKLSRDQAFHLAKALLAASKAWNEIDITVYRLEPRQSDGTYHVTVTSK